MATPLKSTRSHAHSYPLYLGLIPYALISNMVFPVHAINVVKYPQLSCTNPIFFSLSNGLISDLNPVHQCTLDCRVNSKTLSLVGIFLSQSTPVNSLFHLFHVLSILFATSFSHPPSWSIIVPRYLNVDT